MILTVEKCSFWPLFLSVTIMDEMSAPFFGLHIPAITTRLDFTQPIRLHEKAWIKQSTCSLTSMQPFPSESWGHDADGRCCDILLHTSLKTRPAHLPIASGTICPSPTTASSWTTSPTPRAEWAMAAPSPTALSPTPPSGAGWAGWARPATPSPMTGSTP